MSNSNDLDRYPYTGERTVNRKVRASTAEWLNGYFDGTEHYEQVKGITRGKIYDVVGTIGYGDVEDYVIINDNDAHQTIGSFFFEELKPEEIRDENVEFDEKKFLKECEQLIEREVEDAISQLEALANSEHLQVDWVLRTFSNKFQHKVSHM